MKGRQVVEARGGSIGKGYPYTPRPLPTKNFVETIECWLSGAGLLVVWVASALLSSGSEDV